jgi:hypothetical protein
MTSSERLKQCNCGRCGVSDVIKWLPILAELGEEAVARIIEKSPDVQSAILEARENFEKAEEEAAELKKLGHEDEE